jgi:NAD(P)-dependent dehydrogenase (short-subunit alcohol dehydrogenase family)
MTGKNQSEGDRRIVVVAGAASGIGLATIQALTRPGTAVIGLDRTEMPHELDPTRSTKWVRGNVESQETWSRLLTILRTQEPWDNLSLIACAADVVVAPFLQTTLDDWRRLYEVNVIGVILGMQALMPIMLERKKGAIAVVCSVNSFYVESGLSAYCASKAALLQVVRSAALEYARSGVQINAVCPGAVDTPFFHRALAALPDPTGALRAVERRTPTGKILQPKEVAALLCFLVTGAASGLSGAAVTIDGGLTSAYDFDSSSSFR